MTPRSAIARNRGSTQQITARTVVAGFPATTRPHDSHVPKDTTHRMPRSRPTPDTSGAETVSPFKAIGSARTSLAEDAASTCAALHGRDYQVGLARDIVAALESPIGRTALTTSQQVVSSALVAVPTGGGKTLVALAVGQALQRGAELRVGWVAARRELLRQVRGEIRAFGVDLDLRTISLFEKDPPRVDLLVWDEAHRDGCASAATLAARVQPSYMVGLTATPWRSDRARLSYGHLLRRCTIQQLQDDGYLAQFRHVALESWDPACVARTWLADHQRFGKSIMFFRTKAEADICVAALRAGGARADVVCGSSDRQSQLEAFEDGTLDVLVAMGILAEGFSAPWLESVFIRPASRLPTVQMGGRVLRRFDSIPLKNIVQPRNAPLPFTRIARPAEQFIVDGGGWRALGATRDIDAIVAHMRGVVARSAVDMPAIFGKSRGRSAPAAVRGFRTGIDPGNEE